MKKKILLWTLLLFSTTLILLFSVEESRAFIIAFLFRIFFFVKKHLLILVATFFLVKGKFILTLFLKKIALLSAVGLGKRYMIEKVIMENIQIHFLSHLGDDIKRLILHAKKNFKNFTLIKKSIAIFTFLGSLGFVGKFMGGMLAVKVFIAKVWSFLLALFLKVGSSITYFFTDYLWGSWLAPIIEVVIFSWLLSAMEKIPFLAKILRKIYTLFVSIFGWAEHYLEQILHLPIKRFLRWMVKKIQKSIYEFIDYQPVCAYKKLKERRNLNPNTHAKLVKKRTEKKNKKSKSQKYSAVLRVREKREERRRKKRR